MRTLLGTELTRLRWRRAVLVLLAASVLGSAMILAVEAWNTRPVSASEQRAAELSHADHLRRTERDVARCERSPEKFGLDPDLGAAELETSCREWLGGPLTVEDFLTRPLLEPATVADGAGIAVVLVVAVTTLLAGATFVGQDWASGSISNQLLFEPRRGRVWTAKALAVLVWGAATAVLVLTLFWVAVWWLASTRDVPIAAGTWPDVLAMQARAVLLVSGSGLLGYALTTLFRSTVASLGLVAAVAVLGTAVPLAVLGSGSEPLLLPMNALAFLQDGYEYYTDDGMVCNASGACSGITGNDVISLAQGAAYLGVLLLASALASLGSFRSRDLP